jgi:hypothetical protein
MGIQVTDGSVVGSALTSIVPIASGYPADAIDTITVRRE